MNVVMIAPFAFAPKGTVSVRAFFAARALVRRGHQVTILIPPYDHLADSGQEWIREGVRLINLPIRSVTWSTPLSAALALARGAARLRPDVVHVFKPIGYSGLAGGILARLARLPLALDHDDWEGRGGWADINPYPRWWRAFFIWQESDMLRRARAVTVASRTLQTQVWGLGIDPARVMYVPNGPDAALHSFWQDERSREQERRMLGASQGSLAVYLGQIPHGNDLDLALEALQCILPRFPGLKLAVIGTGDGVPALRQEVERRGLEQVVTLTGWMEHARAAQAAACADLALYPYRDSLINRAKCSAKIIEYMTLGLPIVASRVGQNVEYLEHGASGWLAEPGDAASFAEMMVRVLADPERARQMGQAARERIWARFDWDRLVEGMEAAYKKARQDGA